VGSGSRSGSHSSSDYRSRCCGSRSSSGIITKHDSDAAIPATTAPKRTGGGSGSRLLLRNAPKKEEKAAMEAKIEQERAAMEAKIEQIRSEQGLSALQTRLEALHAAKLLSDDERDIIEDKIADSVEGGDDSSGDDTVSQMVALSSKMVVDRAFSRQLRRKWTR